RREKLNAYLGSGSCFDLLGAGADRDRAGFHALRQIALKVDVQKAVVEIGALHFDVVGKLEAALERAGRDAPMQEHTLLIVGLLVAGYDQGLLFDLDLEFIFGEAGDRHGDAVLVVAETLDVVGRVAVALEAADT